MKDELLKQFKDLQEQFNQLIGKINIEGKRIHLKELEFELIDPDLWKNRQLAENKNKEAGQLRDLIRRFDEMSHDLIDIQTNFQSLSDGAEWDKKIQDEIFSVKRKMRQFEVEQFFSGKYDKQAAVVSIFSGAGGQDSEDWVSILYEMYSQYAQKRGWKMKVLDETLGDFQSRTGRHPLKNISIEIKGDYAYGYLKNESGVHRLVRISPFSPEKKRHTSFALVEVLPDMPEVESEELKIPPEDLKIEFSRAGGPGGQNVNKVETAVRIVHLPTNIVVSCRVERSQQQNRERAMKMLKVKLIKLMEETKAKELSQLRTKVKPEWGSQIRSYVLNPYKLVKDHRNNVETSQVDKVLEGDIDLFIEGELSKSL